MDIKNSVRNVFLKARFITILFRSIATLFVCSFVFYGLAPDDGDRTTYFKDTSYELNVYRISGKEPGPTLLIISGIHNEPGGYITADQFVDISLRKGNLIVVPRANFQTIIEDERGVDGDMNRLFDLEEPRYENDYSMQIVSILKELIGESDVMLNLHDGWGYFREEYIDEMHNPLRLGQSIIADAEVFPVPETGESLLLREIAEKICSIVNAKITNEDHYFRFNNHDTFSETTKFGEQQKSATFFALSKYNIPAFGIETSKNISDLASKVLYQTTIVNAFMNEFGIEREEGYNPVLDPQLDFVAISINQNPPQVFTDGSTLHLRPSDTIRISHIEANAERGLYADIVDYGGLNDFGSTIQLFNSTSIIIGKDSFLFGKLNIVVSETAPVYTPASNGNLKTPVVESFLVEVNGYPHNIGVDNTLNILKGDIIKLVNTSPPLAAFEEAKLNFIGYWSRKNRVNDGDDQNSEIDTEVDLDPKYSSWKKGNEYVVRVENETGALAQMKVRLHAPELDHLVLRFDNGNKGILGNGEAYSLTSERSFEIIDVITNVPNNLDVKVNIRGFVGSTDNGDSNLPVHVASELLPEYSVDSKGRRYAIEVSYRDKIIGTSYINLNATPSNQ